VLTLLSIDRVLTHTHTHTYTHTHIHTHTHTRRWALSEGLKAAGGMLFAQHNKERKKA